MKYSLLPAETKIVNGALLTRIVRVQTGEKGGFIETPNNLSQHGECWVHGDSIVFSNAKVSEDAQIYGEVSGNATVSGRAKVYGRVTDNATVTDDAAVYGQAFGSADIGGHANIYGNIGGNHRIGGSEIIYGNLV